LTKGIWSTFHKFALIYDVSKPTFDEIKLRFIEVFPQIEDLKVEDQL
jgi:hypothetical protein